MRISLFAGPCSGKSVVATKIFADLKTNGHNIEYTSEYIKTWAYEKKVPKSFDQYYIFGKQLHAEDVLLSNGVDHIVTDSPLFMQLCYMERSNANYLPLLEIGKEFEYVFPSINIFLSREGLQYQSVGRYENETQALEMDDRIKNLLNRHSIPYTIIRTVDFHQILQHIYERLA